MTLPADPNATVRIDAPTGAVDQFAPSPRHADGCGCTCGAHTEWLNGRAALQREEFDKLMRQHELEQQFLRECAAANLRLSRAGVIGF